MMVTAAGPEVAEPLKTHGANGGAARPPLRGWLTKRKGGASSGRVLGGANRRFFAIDFGSELLYYSHSEDMKRVSPPISFRDILGVVQETPAASPAEAGDNKPKGKLASLAARMPKVPSLGAIAGRGGAPAESLSFVLSTKGREMALVAAARAEADAWVDALRKAAQIGAARRCREEAEAPAASDEQQSTAAGSSGLSSPSPREEEGGDGGAPLVEALHPARFAAPFGGVEAPCPGSLLPAQLDSVKPLVGGSPRAAEELSSSTAWGVTDTGNCKSHRFTDKGQGLSLQRRLEQLEFSDEEDEEDAGGRRVLPATQKADRLPFSQAEVVVVACQAFDCGDGKEDANGRWVLEEIQKADEFPAEVVVESCQAFDAGAGP